jgi:hypothetical protein
MEPRTTLALCIVGLLLIAYFFGDSGPRINLRKKS